ncbi:MAG: C39 family peptidase [Clostridia bacterium]|nr:C39 family peptidase [Clostridia bacterium]
MKKLMAKLLVLALCLSFCVPFTAFATDDLQDVWGDVQQDNFLRITSSEAWNKGTFENTELTEEVGNGAIRLAAGQTEGTWTSQELTVPAFEYMVASWSSDTPKGTSVEIRVRAYVDMKDAWSGWMSWGTWGIDRKRGCDDTADALAYVNTDILTIKGKSGETASKIQVQVVLTSKDEATPVLRDVGFTMKNTLAGQAIPVYHPNAGMDLPEKVLLDTPAYSQMRRDSAIGSVICSPTSVTMMLNDRNPELDLFPEEIALREYDFDYEGFGNWSFSTAIAGSFGYTVSNYYGDLDLVRQELAAGRSVALSVGYSNSTSGSNPYLQNGAASNTPGHLIVIVGYETIDGVEYFYSNDAATKPDSECALRLYRADQLDVCWDTRLAYSISLDTEEGAGQYAPIRVQGTLEPTAEFDVFDLVVNGEKVTLAKGFSKKTSLLGAGTIFMITDTAKMDDMPEGMIRTTANMQLTYITVTGEGKVRLPMDALYDAGVTSGTVYIICNNGEGYEVPVTLPDPSTRPTEPATEAPTEAATEAPTEAPTEAATEATSVEKSGTNPAIIVVGVAIVAAAVVVLAKSKKQ